MTTLLKSKPLLLDDHAAAPDPRRAVQVIPHGDGVVLRGQLNIRVGDD